MKKKTKIISYIIIVAMLFSGIATCYAENQMPIEGDVPSEEVVEPDATDENSQPQYSEEEVPGADTSTEEQPVVDAPVEEAPVVDAPAEEAAPDDTEEPKEDGKKDELELVSEAAIVYCKNTGEIIYKKNPSKKMAPYSVTKVMTTLLAVQKLSLDQEVTISKEAAAQEGSTMNLLEGEIVKVKDLLYGTMILSGNDAAYALAEAVSGDIASFVALMNETAKNIGCKNTLFATPTGYSEDIKTHCTTAKDMLEILRVAFDNETVKNFAGAREYKAAATNLSEERLMESHNEVLLSSPNYVAGKTGFWDEYNSTIVMEYEKDGLDLLIVLLGSELEKRIDDCNALVKYATKKVRGIEVVKAGSEAGNVRVKHGAKTRIKAYTLTAGVAYLPKEGSKSLISTKAVMNDDVEAPVKKGDVVGVYNIYVGDEIVNKIPLVAKESVKTGWILSYIGISNNTTIAICVGAFLLVILLIIRSINKAKARKKRRDAKRRKALEIARQELEEEEYNRRRGWHY